MRFDVKRKIGWTVSHFGATRSVELRAFDFFRVGGQLSLCGWRGVESKSRDLRSDRGYRWVVVVVWARVHLNRHPYSPRVGHTGIDSTGIGSFWSRDLLCHGDNIMSPASVQYASACGTNILGVLFPAKRAAATENIPIPGLSYSIGSASALCIRNPS